MGIVRYHTSTDICFLYLLLIRLLIVKERVTIGFGRLVVLLETFLYKFIETPESTDICVTRFE